MILRRFPLNTTVFGTRSWWGGLTMVPVWSECSVRQRARCVSVRRSPGRAVAGLCEQPADVFGVERRAEGVAVVHDAGEQFRFPGLECHHLLLDGVPGDEPVHHDVPGL